MKENNGTFKKLIIAIGIPILVWGLSGLIVRDSREAFEMLEKPGITPPGWVFPVVWLVLYALMYIVHCIQPRGGNAGNNAGINTYINAGINTHINNFATTKKERPYTLRRSISCKFLLAHYIFWI